MPSSPPTFPLPLHDALPICGELSWDNATKVLTLAGTIWFDGELIMSSNQTGTYVGKGVIYVARKVNFSNYTELCATSDCTNTGDRKSTRLNSSHLVSSYAVLSADFPPSPTRRSSDLRRALVGQRDEGAHAGRDDLVRRRADHEQQPDRHVRWEGRDLRRAEGQLQQLHRALRDLGLHEYRRSEEHTSELQSPCKLVCRPLRRLSPFPYTTLFRSAASSRGTTRRRCSRWPGRSGSTAS